MRSFLTRRPVVGVLLLGVSLVPLSIGFAGAETDAAWPGFLIFGGIGLLVAGLFVLTYRPRVPARVPVAAGAVGGPVAAGWYPDPNTPSLRFWDGEAWTDQRAPLPPRQATPTSAFTIARGVALGIVAVLILLYWVGQNSEPDTVYCPPGSYTASDCY